MKLKVKKFPSPFGVRVLKLHVGDECWAKVLARFRPLSGFVF